jgi:hypothetical protein
MLADGAISHASGQLDSGVLAEGHSRAAVLDFILGQLPCWRDRPDRPPCTNETKLTSQLCAHLNSAARKTSGWDCLQFRVEESDERHASRKYDLVAAGELIVEGRSYNDFETILPIECKRLPTPAKKGRDEREYVVTRVGVRGGIQRYKEGKHGAAHVCAALIAYVQEQGFDHWLDLIGGWIRDLYTAGSPGWSSADTLVTQWQDPVAGIAVHKSVHSRKGLPEIHLRHLWVRMIH